MNKHAPKSRASSVTRPTTGWRWRFATALCFGFLAAITPARAQPHAGPDGFSICPFSNSARGVTQSTIGPCQPLSDRTMQSFGLSPSQIAIVTKLQGFAAAPSLDLLQQLANTKSLAAPRQFAAAGDYSDYWFADATSPSNVELGIHLRYLGQNAKPDLYQMTYAVDGDDGHFTVLWNRTALTTPQR